MPRYQLAQSSEIAPGQMKSFSAGGQRVLVINLNGDFHAVSELCPHLAVPLSRGRLEGECLTCPGHGSQFNVRDGNAVKWIGRKPSFLSSLLDGKPKTLKRYTVSVEAGAVYVDV
jgi:nitrite reductase (NADH) small subunit